MTGPVIVTVDRERCLGSATCVVLAAGLFTLDDDDRAVPPPGPAGPADLLEQAAELCPTGAITLRRPS